MKEKNKKSAIVFLLFFIFLGVLLPLQDTQASWFTDRVVDILKTIASLIIEIFARLLDLAYGILNWVISPDFLGVSMTGPDNPLVSSGWRTIRNLAYLVLILATVAIIFGIILGIREYEAKKVLPVLIIIALLINFTPVICGILIDFSNVLMKYFLSGGLAGGFSEAVKDGFEKAKDFDEPLAIITNALAFIIFGITGILVFLLYALLFAIRYVALWILIIFSPIAFVSRVFPPSPHIKKFFPSIFHWDEWWNQFIQWCVIGIFGALFIYLANNLMVNWITKLSPKQYSLIGGLYAYLFPIILLLIGFFTTLSTTQAFAAEVTSRAKQMAGWTRKALKPIRETALVKSAEERARRFGEKIREAPIIGGTARMRAEAEARHRKEREAKIESEKERLKLMSPETREMFAKTPIEKAALFKLKTEEGKLTTVKDFQEELRAAGISDQMIERMHDTGVEKKDIKELKNREVSEELINKLKATTPVGKERIEELKYYGISPKDLEEAAKRRPDLALPLIEKPTKEVVEKMTPGELREKIQPEALGKTEVFDALRARHIEEIKLRGSGKQKESLRKLVEENAAEFRRRLEYTPPADTPPEMLARLEEERAELERKLGHIAEF